MQSRGFPSSIIFEHFSHVKISKIAEIRVKTGPNRQIRRFWGPARRRESENRHGGFQNEPKQPQKRDFQEAGSTPKIPNFA